MIIGNYINLINTGLWLKLYAKRKTVCGNQNFPKFRKGVYISWESKTREIIDDRGIIRFSGITPSVNRIKFIATLTVNKTYFSDEQEKIKLKVNLVFRYKPLSLKERERLSYEELTYKKILGANKDQRHVISNLTLTNRSSYGMRIKWHSSDEEVLKGNQIRRGTEDKKVFLDAEILAEEKDSKNQKHKRFEIVVKAKEQKDKKVLVMVPHGDDEVFMSYSVIRKAVLRGYKVYVCFFCNCDTKGISEAVQRHKESLSVLGYLGIEPERIICLGYSTKWKKTHIFNTSNEVCYSINGDLCTYGSQYIQDWHTLRTGTPALYTRENVVADICDVLSTILPDIIFVNDFDKHVDHVAYSLLFEEAMGNCLKKLFGYAPVIYKGFVYSTAAYGKPDFFKCYLPYTSKPSHKSKYYPIKSNTELENPSLRWADRIRFKTDKELLNRNLRDNPAVNALLRYHRMYRNIPCFIKRDTVFWKRRTDNLLLRANIKTTSGNATFLNDFKYTDIKRVEGIPYKFDAGEWMPNESDKKKEIEIVFPEKVKFEKMRFYRNRGESFITKISIKFNDDIKIYKLFDKDEPYKDIEVDGGWVDTLIINVIDRKGKRTGFTEIEAYVE